MMEMREITTDLSYYSSRVIGNGAYGYVFEGIFRHQEVAVKRVQLTEIYLRLRSNAREETALRELEHDNVIKFHHSEDDKDFR